MKNYQILRLSTDGLIDYGVQTLEQPAIAGDLLTIPTCDLPADFSVDTYTIVDGQLVRASDKLIAERQALRLAAETQAVTQARAARYTTQTDALLFDAMEQFALDHPENEALAAWLVAKNQVRAELPKPINTTDLCSN